MTSRTLQGLLLLATLLAGGVVVPVVHDALHAAEALVEHACAPVEGASALEGDHGAADLDLGCALCQIAPASLKVEGLVVGMVAQAAGDGHEHVAPGTRSAFGQPQGRAPPQG